MIHVRERAAMLEEIEPLIECRELPAFETAELESVRRAFQNATPLPLRQAWREKEESDFAPALVRTGWRAVSLLVFAELTDEDIFNLVTAHNQPAWLRGDTFEIFLRPIGQPAYVEFHVTPNNHRLQLRYLDAEAFDHAKKSGCLNSALVPGEAFRSVTWMPEAGQWFVYAEIPARSVCDQIKSLDGCRWRFSFSRYDYTRGGKAPVLSSTSAHAAPDFHRQDEWSVMAFQPFLT